MRDQELIRELDRFVRMAEADANVEHGNDVTAHVDFQALALAAEDIGGRVHGPIEQGSFLRRLGIETRAVTLMTKATPQVSEDIAGALKRLTESGRGGMGSLFKVLGISHPSLTELAALTDPPPDAGPAQMDEQEADWE